MGLVFSISIFFITKTPLANNWRRKKIPSCSYSALVSSISSKKLTIQVNLRYHSSEVEFICLLFGRIHGLTICFRVLLTFCSHLHHWPNVSRMVNWIIFSEYNSFINTFLFTNFESFEMHCKSISAKVVSLSPCWKEIIIFPVKGVVSRWGFLTLTGKLFAFWQIFLMTK